MCNVLSAPPRRQVIECRRILKWTYAYGYYSWPDEEDAAMGQRRQFFEFLQGDAERILDQVRRGLTKAEWFGNALIAALESGPTRRCRALHQGLSAGCEAPAFPLPHICVLDIPAAALALLLLPAHIAFVILLPAAAAAAA